MARIIRRRGSPAGAPPGTLIAHSGAAPPSLRVMLYGDTELHEPALSDVGELVGMRGRAAVLWVDVAGLGDVALVRAIGQLFGLSELTLEDVLNIHQRPKVERFGEYLFLVVRSVTTGTDTEQVGLFLGPDFVLSFQERAGDCFDQVRQRLRHGAGRLRAAGADYLLYALVDELVDDYFPVLEAHGERLENLEEAVLAGPVAEHMNEIHRLKRHLLGLRRAVWPARETIGLLIHDDDPLLGERARLHLRDTQDHAIQLLDMLETYREVATELQDIYMSCLSTRMNEVMKVLTVIATLFIPLSFLAGLWGMNFDPESPWNMPELRWRYGYPLALGLMAAVAVGLLWYFRRRGWLGRDG